MEAIFSLGQLMKKYREEENLHMVFTDLNKAYDRVRRDFDLVGFE